MARNNKKMTKNDNDPHPVSRAGRSPARPTRLEISDNKLSQDGALQIAAYPLAPNEQATTSMDLSQIITKKRVADHGEVLTGSREVNTMLDLVKQETDRIDSRFFEPACGNGNFLAVVLERKLAVVQKRYAKSQLEFERYAVLAVSSIYGVDILDDNVRQCRERLYGVFDRDFYSALFKKRARRECGEAVRFILERNIIWGDALTLKTVGENFGYIVFSEWSPVNGSMLKRRDFTFHSLLEHEGMKALPLFSDLGDDVFIPTPEREYPPTHFLEIPHADR